MSRSLSLRPYLTQGLLLLLLLIFVFPGVFLRREMVAPGDILFLIPPWAEYAPEGFERPQNPLMSDVITAFFPYYALTERALEEGAWPLWNPLEFAGMPLLANCQTAIFYIPRLLHSFFELRLATTLYILLKLWLCGMAAFICARGLGFDLRLSRFFSVAWMLASYNLIWANWSLPDVSVWLPILFLGVELILQRRYRRGVFAMAIGGTLILLAGHPETAFCMAVGTGGYFLARLLLERRWGADLWKPIAACTLAWTIALGTCAAQLLPFLEYLMNSSTLFERHATPVDHLLPAHAATGFWVPRFFGTSADGNYYGDSYSNYYGMLYAGIGVWVGMLALLAPGRLAPLRRQQCAALFVAIAVGALLAFSLPPSEYVHRLPVFSSTVRPYHIAFSIFALPLLGVLGLEHWLSRPRRQKDLVWLLPGVVVPALLLWFAYDFHAGLIRAHGLGSYVQWQLLVAALLTVAALGLLMLILRPKVQRLALALLTVLLAADLIYANRNLNPTLPRDKVFPRTALTDYLQGLGTTRVSVGDGFIPSGLMAPYGIEDWLAYDGLYPARMHYFQKEMGPDIYTALEPATAKEYYLHRPDLPPQFPLEEPGRFEKVSEHDGVEVYRNLRAFPRAFLAAQVRLVPEREALFEAMKQPGYDPAEEVLTLDTPEARAAVGAFPGATGPLGTTRLLLHESTRVVVEAQAEASCVLVLADAYYPGWKAFIDGVEQPLFPAYEVFRGLILPAGEHTVEFLYRPLSFYLGLGISCMTLLLSGAAGVYLLRRRDAVGDLGA